MSKPAATETLGAEPESRVGIEMHNIKAYVYLADRDKRDAARALRLADNYKRFRPEVVRENAEQNPQGINNNIIEHRQPVMAGRVLLLPADCQL